MVEEGVDRCKDEPLLSGAEEQDGEVPVCMTTEEVTEKQTVVTVEWAVLVTELKKAPGGDTDEEKKLTEVNKMLVQKENTYWMYTE